MSLQSSVMERTGTLEETLQLRCPGCNGGLNLRRKHLGITGQCVHCHSALTAIEECGSIRVVMGAAPAITRVVPEEPAPASRNDAPPPIQEITKSGGPSLSPQWGFPERNSGPRELDSPSPPLNSIPRVLEEPISINLPLADTLTTDFAQSLKDSTRQNLFGEQAEIPVALSQPATPPSAPSLFDDREGFQMPFSSLFKVEENPVELSETWGTKVPQESHASISPFATPSPGGGGFAETLFRDKVIKESSSEDFTISIPFSVAKPQAARAPVTQECAPKVILDGDGRPLAPMTKEEEEEFAKNFFAMERARGKQPKWRKRLVRFLTMVIVLGFAGLIAFFVTPREKLVEWKTKAVTWLEPGMAILDYLPEGMRPDWLPRTDFGIDTGVDENGKPKPKMNAFEGLEKLKVDIGNMRGAADEELKNLNDF